MLDEKLIGQIIQNVINNMPAGVTKSNQLGVFDSMSDALVAVEKAYKQLKNYTVAQREKMIANIRRLCLEEAENMARLGVSETGMGRVEDKIIKHQLVANKTPGTRIFTLRQSLAMKVLHLSRWHHLASSEVSLLQQTHLKQLSVTQWV